MKFRGNSSECETVSSTYILGEISCNNGRHDSRNGPECVCDPQEESCIAAGTKEEIPQRGIQTIISGDT